MATRNLVVRGRVGFASGDVEYLITHGLDAAIGESEPIRTTRRTPSQVTRTRSELSNNPNLPTRKSSVDR